MKGHDIMALERFDPEVRHMVVFIKLKNHAKVHNGYLNYDHKDRDL